MTWVAFLVSGTNIWYLISECSFLTGDTLNMSLAGTYAETARKASNGNWRKPRMKIYDYNQVRNLSMKIVWNFQMNWALHAQNRIWPRVLLELSTWTYSTTSYSVIWRSLRISIPYFSSIFQCSYFFSKLGIRRQLLPADDGLYLREGDPGPLPHPQARQHARLGRGHLEQVLADVSVTFKFINPTELRYIKF